MEKSNGNIQTRLKCLNKYMLKNFDLQWHKLWYYGKKKLWYYEKNMILYRKLWKFDLLWINYGTIVNYSSYIIFLLGKGVIDA